VALACVHRDCRRIFSLQIILTSRERAKEYNSLYENVTAQYYRQENMQYTHKSIGYKTLKNKSTGRKYEATKHDRKTPSYEYISQ
jgi:hypothetical protein